MSGKTSAAEEQSSVPVAKRSSRLKWLAIAAVVYSLWMIWLLYVGIVNYQAGNQ